MFLSLLAAAAAASAAVPAQTDEASTIIVTGERIARDMQTTQASVAVTTAEDIERLANPDRVDQLLALIPNVQLGAGDQAPTIRGQDATGVLQGADAFLGGSRPRATLQIDGRAVGYNEFVYGLASVWDVARVEIYRGPQTTTQGRNAIAGAIFIETNAPTYDWQGTARALVGDFETRQISGAVGGPIVADQLAVRVAGDYRTSRSWVNYGTNLVVGADPTKDSYGLARFKLLAEPRALPGLRLDVTYTHLENSNPQGEAIDAPFERRTRAIANGGYFRTNVDSLVGRLRYELAPDVEASLTTAYGDYRIDRFAPVGNGRATIVGSDLSFEAIVTAGRAGQAQGLLGVYNLNTDQDEAIDLTAFIGNGTFADEQHSFGVFGEATVPFGRFALTGGLRYQRDRQDRAGFLGTPAFGFGVDYDRTFEAWLPKAALSYKLTDDATLGISAQRGFNPGGTTISFDTGLQDEFEAETLWNYELFARTRLAPGLRVNGNIFYTQFRNAQRSLITVQPGSNTLVTEIDNAPRARSYGAEVAAAWTPSARFALRGAVGLLRTRITRAIVPTDPIEGKTFQRAPEFSASGAVSWSPVSTLRFDAQLRHNSRYFSDDANTPALAIGGSTTVDGKISYRLSSFTLAAYARNLFDDFQVTQLYAPAFGTANDPREFGLSIEARF